jgi:hypothetical protein
MNINFPLTYPVIKPIKESVFISRSTTGGDIVLLTFTTQPIDQIVAISADATFTVLADGSGTILYQWQDYNWAAT